MQVSKAKERVRDKYQKKGHAENEPQMIISFINNKLQHLNTSASLSQIFPPPLLSSPGY